MKIVTSKLFIGVFIGEKLKRNNHRNKKYLTLPYLNYNFFLILAFRVVHNLVGICLSYNRLLHSFILNENNQDQRSQVK